MRKNYIFYIVLFLAGLMTFGCEKYLAELPQNKLKPTSTDDYNQILNYAYLSESIMPYLDFLADDCKLYPELRTSAMTTVITGDRVLGAYLWYNSHEETMPTGDIAFRKLYESIFYTNVVIDNIDNALGVEMSETNVRRTRNNIKGEAFALRAYSYFYLINLYGKYFNPATASEDMGVPINLSSGVADKPYKRNTVKEVYDQMVEDLITGIKLMEENPLPKIDKIKFTPLAAKAMLARVYLYMHEWDRAIEQASAVIRENNAIFSLYEAGEQPIGVFTEVIGTPVGSLYAGLENGYCWGTDYLSINNPNVILINGLNENLPCMSWYQSLTAFGVNPELADQFEPNDVRRNYFMYTHTQTLSSVARTKLTYGKHRAQGMTLVGMQFAISRESGFTRVIRTEEMYLILAEANAHKNNMNAAVDYLNQLREPKFKRGTYTPLVASNFNQQSLFDYVALERRRELCFEGHRWFDLRRTTRPAMQHEGYSGGGTLRQDDPRYVLQIPMRELSANPQIGFAPR